jgi:glucokinase
MGQDCFVGVDLGGTRIKIAVGDRQGNILCENRIPTQSHEGPEGVLGRIADEATRLLDQVGTRPAGLGMAVPATNIDLERGIVNYVANFPGHWPGVPVADIVGKRMGCPVHVLNDVRTATLGELDFGLGRGEGVNTMVLFALGTGIGGGIVVNKRLHLGAIGSAGELGHMIVQPFGRPCGCGARGCLETIASGPALAAEGVRLLLSGQAPHLHDIVQGNSLAVNTESMGRAVQAGDKQIQVAIERAASYLGLAICNLTVALHPDLFVIGGGVAGLGDLLFKPIRQAVCDNLRLHPGESVRIEPSALGDKTGMMGAITLAIRGGNLG